MDRTRSASPWKARTCNAAYRAHRLDTILGDARNGEMYIRNRQEALDALAEVLELPDRTSQIVQITVKVALCLEPDARQFLADCQAGLIEGGLERMRQARRQMLAEMSSEDHEAIVIVESDHDELLERVGTTLDSMRIVDIIREVFPALARRYASWQLARAVLSGESVVRECLLAAVRHRNEPTRLGESENIIVSHVEAQKPSWMDSARLLEKACQDSVSTGKFQDGVTSPADDPRVLYDIVAATDENAETVLTFLSESQNSAAEYLFEVRRRIHLLHEASEQHNG